jgi:hypothetical protein
VEAALASNGDVDVETGSSAIRVTCVHGALTASTQSGRITLAGTPTGTWSVSTGSSGVELSIAAANFGVEAESGSGSVKVENATVQGSVSKGRVSGSVGTGGPLVKVTSRSGSIRIVGRL